MFLSLPKSSSVTRLCLPKVRRSLVGAVLLVIALSGLGLPSGVDAAQGHDIYAGGYFRGSVECRAEVYYSGVANYPYRHYVTCWMMDARGDGLGVYASIQIQNSGGWVLSASQCANRNGAGTETSCSASFLSAYSGVYGVMRWGLTNGNSYSQHGIRYSLVM